MKTHLLLASRKSLPLSCDQSCSFWQLQPSEITRIKTFLQEISIYIGTAADQSIILQFKEAFHSPFLEGGSGKVSRIDNYWCVRLDPLTVRCSFCCLILVCNVVVMLEYNEQADHERGGSWTEFLMLTSRRSGVSSLNFPDATFDDEAILGPPFPGIFACSAIKTPQAVVCDPCGGTRAFTLSSLIFKASFWVSVKAFFFDLGLAVGFFPGLGFGLILGFPVDLALGLAFGLVFCATGFLAAFVFEVVGAFRAAVVVLPV